MRRIFSPARHGFKRFNSSTRKEIFSAIVDTLAYGAIISLSCLGSYIYYNMKTRQYNLQTRHFIADNLEEIHQQAIKAGMESLKAHIDSDITTKTLMCSKQDLEQAKVVTDGDFSEGIHRVEINSYLFPTVCVYQEINPFKIEKKSCSVKFVMQETRVDFIIPYEANEMVYGLKVTVESLQPAGKDPKFVISKIDLFDTRMSFQELRKYHSLLKPKWRGLTPEVNLEEALAPDGKKLEGLGLAPFRKIDRKDGFVPVIYPKYRENCWYLRNQYNRDF